MAGMEKATEWWAGREEQRRGKAQPSVALRAGIFFSRAHRASPAMATGVSLSASALRPGLECCRQLGVM